MIRYDFDMKFIQICTESNGNLSQTSSNISPQIIQNTYTDSVNSQLYLIIRFFCWKYHNQIYICAQCMNWLHFFPVMLNAIVTAERNCWKKNPVNVYEWKKQSSFCRCKHIRCAGLLTFHCYCMKMSQLLDDGFDIF